MTFINTIILRVFSLEHRVFNLWQRVMCKSQLHVNFETVPRAVRTSPTCVFNLNTKLYSVRELKQQGYRILRLSNLHSFPNCPRLFCFVALWFTCFWCYLLQSFCCFLLRSLLIFVAAFIIVYTGKTLHFVALLLRIIIIWSTDKLK